MSDNGLHGVLPESFSFRLYIIHGDCGDLQSFNIGNGIRIKIGIRFRIGSCVGFCIVFPREDDLDCNPVDAERLMLVQLRN